MRDYYADLGVLPFAEQEAIDGAYRALIKKYHPDRSSGPVSQRRAQEINEAYHVLKNPVSRQSYDAARSQAFPEFGGVAGGSSFNHSRVPTPPPDVSNPADRTTVSGDQFAWVRRALLLLIVIYAAIIIYCVAMYHSGAWKRVPASFIGEKAHQRSPSWCLSFHRQASG